MHVPLYKLSNLLNRREKTKLLLILALNTVVGIIQALGVLSVMPFIAVLTDPTLVDSNAVLTTIKAYLPFQHPQAMTVFLGLGALLILIIGHFLKLFNYWLTLRFLNYKDFKLSTQLLRYYLSQDLISFNSRSNAEMTKNIVSEVDRVLMGSLLYLVNTVSNIVIAITLIIFLIFVDPIVTLTSAVSLGIAYFIVYFIFVGRITKLGEDFTSYETEIYSGVKQGLAFHKEMLISGARNYFLGLFSRPAKALARNGVAYNFLTEIPTVFIEIFAFTLIIIIAVYTSTVTQSPASTMSTIAFYAFAVYRLVPALKEIFDGIEEYKYLEESLILLLSDYEASDKRKSKESFSKNKFAPRKSISVKELSFRYNSDLPFVLKDLTVSIPIGKLTCITGPSGIGKSTFFDLLLGVLDPQKGIILIDDEELGIHNLRSWRDCIGYVPQKCQLLSASVAENIAFGHRKASIDYDRVTWAAKVACLDDFISNHLPNGYDTLIGDGEQNISGGQLQRLIIARSLYEMPKILFFDEATNELDIHTEQQLFNNLSSLDNLTIVFISHKPSVFERADHIIDFSTEQSH